MYGSVRKKRSRLHIGAALLLALCFCAGVPAQATAPTMKASAAPRMLVPVGHTVGIKLFARGVLVVKLSEGGTPAKSCGLQTGDVIVQCGGVSVTSTEQFQALLQKNGGTETDLQVRREGRNLTLSVEPKATQDGAYGIGAWVRDSMAGIGTMTYYDPSSGNFGALGHGITDVDTSQLLPFSTGSILPSTVKALRKGAAGEAGELRGNFDLSQDLGALSANTDRGIFGTLDPRHQPEQCKGALPVAKRSELHAGPAEIRANVRGDEVAAYQVEILKVTPRAADGRELLISITDPALLEQTGGIVQGMSGSPILQDGKFVGAVTHVLLNDPTRGYGISMETMLEAAE